MNFLVVINLLVFAGIIVFLTLFPSLAWGEIHAGIYGVVANTIVMVVVSLLTPPMDPEHVEQFATT